jgi:hypothetical protein
MKKNIPILLLFLFTNAGLYAQEKLSKKDTDEIRFNARRKVEKDLPELMNTLNLDDLGDYERKTLMLNSYLTSNNQVFYADGVIIEDDLKPDRPQNASTVDVAVGKYLSNFDLFYKKSGTSTIEVSNVVVGPVKERNDQFYVQVFYSSNFKGKHKTIKTAYITQQRVAELRAEKIDKQWVTLISSIRYFKEETNNSENIAKAIRDSADTAKQKAEESAAKLAFEKKAEEQAKREELKKKQEDDAKATQLKKEEEEKLALQKREEEAKNAQLKKEEEAKNALLKKDEVDKSTQISQEKTQKEIETTRGQLTQANTPQLEVLKSQLSSYKSKKTLLTLVSLVSIGAGVGVYVISNGKYDDYVAKINANNSSYSGWYSSVFSGLTPPSDELAKPMSSSDFAPTAMLSLGAGLGVGIISFLMKGKYGRLARETQSQINGYSNPKVSLRPNVDFSNQTTGLSLVMKF